MFSPANFRVGPGDGSLDKAVRAGQLRGTSMANMEKFNLTIVLLTFYNLFRAAFP